MKNPYDFVPFEGGSPKRNYRPNTQEKFDNSGAYSGQLVCELCTETPLFVHGEDQQRQKERQFFQRNRRFIIPASTIKGLIRSVAEVASDSCMSVISEEYDLFDRDDHGNITNRQGDNSTADKHFRTYRSRINWGQFVNMHQRIDMRSRGYAPCESRATLCLCCAMFGMTEKTSQEEEKKAAIAGRVFFTDAIGIDTREERVVMPSPGGGPHPWHRLFYFDIRGNDECLGRKFYYHHRDYTQTLRSYFEEARERDRNLQGITLLARKGRFELRVRFDNLSTEELSTLLYSLELSRNFGQVGESGMRHHLGFAKPYGLGTVKITITHLQLETNGASGPARFLKYKLDDASHFAERDPGWWRELASKAWGDPPRPNSNAAKSNLEQILRWPQMENFKYPDFNWFRGRTAGSISLQEYQNGRR